MRSTLGAWGMIKNGEEKVTYNHCDSYPEGLGKYVIEFAHEHLQKLNEIYDRIELVNESDKPTAEQWEYCKEVGDISMSVGLPEELDWNKALKNAQSDGIGLYAKGLKYMSEGKSFLLDSLFCQYAYIINLDTNVVELYKGSNHDPEAAGRYAYSHNHHATVKNDDYFGVALVGEIPFLELGSCKITNEELQDGSWVKKLTYISGEIIF